MKETAFVLSVISMALVCVAAGMRIGKYALEHDKK